MEKAIDNVTKEHLEKAADLLSRRLKTRFAIEWSQAPRQPMLVARRAGLPETPVLYGPAPKGELYTWMKGFAKGLTWSTFA